MTIENLKQIAIKYATTKGSRVPLAPDELCNAVVQYFNEFLKITADINTIQVAVTEEGGNIVFTITGNTLDGKAFTPIVITVDHNDFVTNQEFEEFKTSVTKQLNNKLDKSNWAGTVYIVDSQGIQNNVAYTSNPSPNTFVYRDDNSNFVVNSPTENGNPTPKSYVDNALTNLADVTKENTFTDVNHFTQYITSFGVEIGTGNADDDEYDISIQESGIEIFHYISGSKANSLRITENEIMTIVYPSNEYNIFDFPNKSGTLALTSDIPAIPEYTSVDSVIYDTTNGAIIAYDGAHEIHIPLQAGKNVTIDASEDNKKIVISAAGGGGTGGGTGDVIKNPIYFISFYANEPSEPCHLIGTMMSKNSYGTGQKTNEEFAVMLADNLYTNSNEGLAAYGRLAEKDILCIYSEDGLSIRCLNEENSEVDLPTVMFFVMETEL